MKFKFLLVSIFILQLVSGQEYLSFKTKQITDQKVRTMPVRSVGGEKSNQLTVTYSFENAGIGRKVVKSEEYQFLHFEGFAKMAQVGAPALPMHNDLIAVPGVEVPVVKIIAAEYTDIQGYNIHPTLEPERDTEGAAPVEFQKDERIYSRDAFFPKEVVTVENVHHYREIPIAVVQTRPMQYNPVTKTLRVYSKITYQVNYTATLNSKSINENSLHALNLLKGNILNAAIVNTTKVAKEGSTDPNYLIVAHSAYAAAADTLAKWKAQMGYNVEVIIDGSWDAAKVKESIHSRYQAYTPKPDYFVIIGDHTGDYAVPGEEYYEPKNEDLYATDLYYACMDGGDDYYPDMAHGRISVSSPAQAMTVVRKIVNYERNPVTNASFYENGLNCAQFQDVADDEAPDGYAARRFCHTSENIRDYLKDDQDYTVERIYYTDGANTPTNFNNGYYSNGEAIPTEMLRANNFDWNGGAAEILSSINAGKFYVFHRDHGYSGGIGWAHPRFLSENTYGYASNVNQLSNGSLLPVVFSINCHTGEFKLDQCFAEEFLRHDNGGAVGVVAAACYSYSGYNDGFATGMVDAMWSNPGLTPTFGSGGNSSPVASDVNNIRTMGDVVNQGLARMIETWNDNRYTHRLFHWFGDPAMRMWTENPNSNTITATIPASVECDATSFTITGCNVEGATVTLVVNNQLVAKALVSGGSATLTFDYAGNSEQPAIVTISKENHKPLMANAEVLGDCVFPPVAKFIADQSTIQPGESVQFTDASLNNPNTWAWTFEGATPSESTTQNPVVTYHEAGTYDVTLRVSSENGSDELLLTDFIVVAELQYCSATSDACDEHISNVSLNTIENASDCGNYQDYTSISTDLSKGSTYPIVVTNPNDYSSDKVGCWIDWNQDKDFEDADEAVVITYSNGSGTGNVVVPDHALAGNTRMRIRILYNGTPQPCGDSDYGEVEDYTVNIIDNNTYTLTFKVGDESYDIEGATVTLSDDQSQQTNASGIAMFNGLEYGTTVEYSVAADGYKPKSGSVEIDGNVEELISLKQEKFNVNFTVNNGTNAIEGATITLGDQTLLTNEQGKANFSMVPGDYDYTISADTYVSASGEISLSDVDVDKTVSLNLEKFNINFTVNNGTNVVAGATVMLSDQTELTDNSGKISFLMQPGDYNYTISAEGYKEANGNINLQNTDVDKTVTLSFNTGFGDLDTKEITIYPNPTNGMVMLKGTHVKDATISVYDLQGAKLISKTADNNQIEIDLSKYAEGAYIFQIESNQKVYKKLIIKE